MTLRLLESLPEQQEVEPPGDLSRRFHYAAAAIEGALEAFGIGDDRVVAVLLERALGEVSAGQAEAERVEALVALVATVTSRCADHLSTRPGEVDGRSSGA